LRVDVDFSGGERNGKHGAAGRSKMRRPGGDDGERIFEREDSGKAGGHVFAMLCRPWRGATPSEIHHWASAYSMAKSAGCVSQVDSIFRRGLFSESGG